MSEEGIQNSSYKEVSFPVLTSGEGFLTISSYKLMTSYPWKDLGAFK